MLGGGVHGGGRRERRRLEQQRQRRQRRLEESRRRVGRGSAGGGSPSPPHPHHPVESASRNSSIAKQLAVLFDDGDAGTSPLSPREGGSAPLGSGPLELTALSGQRHAASLLRTSHDEGGGTSTASASTSEASASNSEQLLRTPPRGHGGGLVGQGRCEVGGKLSIDVEQATADLADQLAAVCCSPPRHHLPYYRGSSPERAPWE